MKNKLIQAHLALLSVNLIYGANYIIAKKDKQLLGYFGVIHPKIIGNTYGFEIFLENLVKYKIKNFLIMII